MRRDVQTHECLVRSCGVFSSDDDLVIVDQPGVSADRCLRPLNTDV